MVSTRSIKPERVKNDKYKTNQTEKSRNEKYETYQTRKSQEWLVPDLSNRKEPQMLSTRLIKPERAKNDKYETN